ncbi:multicomponent Na+:H+ antiporter subunit C [Alkalibacillus flavidus]|uniref:Multicomponent Na+:H+ antiporter subunit C n=1 Tax=Alkalibacillus flavidus TaxID=546021 RepID=A0ABV2KTP0_9BACI
MEFILIGLASLLFGTGIYNLLQKQLLRIIIGTVLVSHGAHLFLLTMARVKTGAPPLISDASSYTDPLPQALILTAIVISFGVTSFLLVLAYRTYTLNKTDNMEEMRGREYE